VNVIRCLPISRRQRMISATNLVIRRRFVRAQLALNATAMSCRR